MSERSQVTREALLALSNAAVAIAAELSLDRVLQQIVDSARVLIGAQYCALGVPNAEGGLEEFVHSGMRPEIVAKMEHLPRGHGLLGAIIRERRPIRIPSISKDVRSVGFPAHHPPMVSFLGVPIVAGNKTLGNLYLTEKQGAPAFSAADQELALMLAAHAAVAIQNARLYEQVGRLAIVEERSRIGMDLHDGVIQSIYAVGLMLESARLMLGEEQQETAALLDNAILGLNDAIRDIRNFILDLRPRRFEGDLEQGLARLAREFQANTMVPVELSVPAGDVSALSPAVARAVFLTAQEALANVARHARASQVHLLVTWQPDRVVLTIEDDGQGFDQRGHMSSTGHGLSNMRARAEERGGSFQISSRPGRGTRVELALPIR